MPPAVGFNAIFGRSIHSQRRQSRGSLHSRKHLTMLSWRTGLSRKNADRQEIDMRKIESSIDRR
ncbi:hypothetical protein, partial [Candidatus Binatus sp.]|uniref:hypothetical protein n=1 Tax=Candidatus Binatus sp. TaxID=2811406 RepID=UPI003CC6DD31